MTFAQIMPPSTAPRPDLPPTWRQIADKPAGGFVQCRTDLLLLPWGLYRAGRLDFLGLRTWLGLLELPERRCDRAPDRDVHYSLDELCQILDIPRRAPVQAAVRTLEDLGLVTWSMSSIAYLPTSAALHYRALPGYQALQAQLHPWRTWVPVPRRLVRWLAREGTPGLYATAAGVLLRCLWSKQRQCVSGGRVAAAWIAEGFGLAKRTVQRALEDLQQCGWLARLRSTDADAATERWHGARTVVNLQWNVPGALEPEDADKALTPKKASREKSRPVRQEVSVEHSVKHPPTLDQNLSPFPCDFDQNVSPLPHQTLSETPEKYGSCATPSGIDFYPLQEQRPDPLPALPASTMPTDVYKNVPTGVCQKTPDINKHALAQDVETPLITPDPTPPASTCPTLLEDPTALFAAFPCAEQEELLQAATVRLVARGLPAALLIRPVVFAEVYASMAPPSLATAPGEARCATSAVAPLPPRPSRVLSCQAPSTQAAVPVRLAPLVDPAAVFAALPQSEQEAMLAAVTARLLAQGMRKELLIRPVLLAEVYAQMTPSPQATPHSVRCEVPAAPRPPRAGALAKAPGAGAPPDLCDVVPADLRDVARLEALRQQAIRRGWLTESAADRLNFVAAAVHARRVGATPCALFVAVVRDQRWEVMTNGDEDEARALLRQRDPRPVRQSASLTRGLSEEAQFVRGVQQILSQAKWRDDPFLAIVERYPDWTRARWDAALAELHAASGRQALPCLGEVLEED